MNTLSLKRWNCQDQTSCNLPTPSQIMFHAIPSCDAAGSRYIEKGLFVVKSSFVSEYGQWDRLFCLSSLFEDKVTRRGSTLYVYLAGREVSSADQERQLFRIRPGVEPGSIAWKATMLTATPSTPWQSSATAYVGCLNQSLTQLRRCSYFSYILQFDTVDGAVVSVITSYGTDSCNYGFLACRLDSKCYCVDRESNPDRLLGRQPC
ncbi:hypothetical protein M514_11832 [Trichuris suis]|uniref:Uncharacterized protein n=1 Tax=Trichuris suis TaxID=68888 RepID=A0A085MTT9_9BILA|nr:hypothetical protein M514_11832 [Trichuris suis]